MGGRIAFSPDGEWVIYLVPAVMSPEEAAGRVLDTIGGRPA